MSDARFLCLLGTIIFAGVLAGNADARPIGGFAAIGLFTVAAVLAVFA